MPRLFSQVALTVAPNSLTLIPILYLLGAAQGAFLALALFASKGANCKANRYLGLVTLLFVVVLIDYVADYTAFTAVHLWASILLWPKEFFIGPLIYFYVSEITAIDNTLKKNRPAWLHFIPGMLHIAVTWPLLFVQNVDLARTIIAAEYGHGYDAWAFWFGDIEDFLTQLQLGIYLLLSLRLLRAHRQRVKQHFSYSEQVSLRWLQGLLWGLLAVYAVWLAGIWLSEDSIDLAFSGAMGLSIVLLIYVMGFMGLRQPQVFAGKLDAVVPEPAPEEDSETGKYLNSALSSDLSKALLDELSALMTKDKLYLDAQLSLPQLAERLGVSVNYLSQAINEQAGQNFFDYVNRFRVDDAVARMTTDKAQTRTILDIGLDAGFNSKSAFYAAFKKFHEMTPGQFRKTL